MDWVLHIGTQKTGSKAIQRYLVDGNLSTLERSVLFPESGREGLWHQPIYDELLAGNSKMLQMASQEGEASCADVGVISCEAMYLFTSSQIELLFRTLGRAKVVIFIRRQDQLVNSMYNQLIKAHRVNFEYIKNYESQLLNYNPDFDHMSTIERWGKVFGFDNIIPIIYDKNTNAVHEFLLNIEINNVSDAKSSLSSNPNPALDASALTILRAVKQLNDKDEDLPPLVGAAHQVLRYHFVDTYSQGDQYLLTLAQRSIIYEFYRESNSAINDRYFSGRECLFPELESSEMMISTENVDMDVVRMIYREAGMALSV